MVKNTLVFLSNYILLNGDYQYTCLLDGNYSFTIIDLCYSRCGDVGFSLMMDTATTAGNLGNIHETYYTFELQNSTIFGLFEDNRRDQVCLGSPILSAVNKKWFKIRCKC
jgi:hypothetical protein